MFSTLGRRLTLITCYQNKHPGTLLSRAGEVSTLLDQPHAGPKKPSHRHRFSLYSNLSNRLHGHSYITQINDVYICFHKLGQKGGWWCRSGFTSSECRSSNSSPSTSMTKLCCSQAKRRVARNKAGLAKQGTRGNAP